MPLPMHPNALIAAKAFAAVYLQCSALANSFQAQLFANQAEFDKTGEPYLYELAEKIGVDVATMKHDMDGEHVAKILAQDHAEFETHGFKGTPSFMIGTEAVTGARHYAEIKKIVDRQLGL